MKGFETFLANIQSQLKDPLDLIVSSIHWILVQEFEFKCVGVGEKIHSEQETSTGSELLPTGWNSTPGSFTLLYRAPNRKEFILKCVAADKLVIATLSPLGAQSSREICSASILKSEFVDDGQSGDLKTLIENFKQEKINRLDSLLKEKFSTIMSNQKSPVKKTEEYPMPPPFSKIPDTQAKPRSLLEDDPLCPRIGGADLDPLGRGIGGGMIFDPFSSGVLRPQRGPRPRFPGNDVVPPGARYDPIGPLPDARFFKPDPDHFQPPRGPGFDPNFM